MALVEQPPVLHSDGQVGSALQRLPETKLLTRLVASDIFLVDNGEIHQFQMRLRVNNSK